MRATDKGVRERLLEVRSGHSAVIAGRVVTKAITMANKWMVGPCVIYLSLDETLRELGAGEEVAQ